MTVLSRRIGVNRVRSFSLGVALVATACATDPSPSIAINLSPDSLSVQQGSAGSITAAIARKGGFTGNVDVQVEGGPNGVTASVANITTGGASTTGTVNIAVDRAVAPRTYHFTVRASGSGVSDVFAFIVLTVTAAPAIGLRFDPLLTVTAGQNGTVQLTIERIGFTGNVTLAPEDVPPGITATFAPNPTATNASTLTIGVDTAVVEGLHFLYFRATAPGAFDSRGEVELVVSKP